jgi:hypothetical protein
VASFCYGDDDARCERDDVAAVVPPRALGFELAACGRPLQPLEAEGVLDLVRKARSDSRAETPPLPSGCTTRA